jgi:hypothetical protein
VRGNGDVQHLGANPFVKALYHAIRLRRARVGVAILSPKLGAASGKTTAVVGQHVSAMKRECCGSLPGKCDGAGPGFVVPNREMDGVTCGQFAGHTPANHDRLYNLTAPMDTAVKASDRLFELLPLWWTHAPCHNQSYKLVRCVKTEV